MSARYVEYPQVSNQVNVTDETYWRGILEHLETLTPTRSLPQFQRANAPGVISDKSNIFYLSIAQDLTGKVIEEKAQTLVTKLGPHARNYQVSIIPFVEGKLLENGHGGYRAISVQRLG